MAYPEWPRVGYVLKRYPRYSETFILSELLAHEASGLEAWIFSLYPPNDTHFQSGLADVRAPVNYLPREGLKAADLWAALEEIGAEIPGLWPALAESRGEQAGDVYQAAVLARAVQAHEIEHLHAHFGSGATTVARLAARIAGISYTCTVHAKDIFHESVQPAQLARKLGDAAATITVSDYNVRFLRERFGPAAARVRRIYNGLDLSRYPYYPTRDPSHRIVAVGRLVEKKGFDDLLEACAFLAARNRRLECQIIGTGPQESALRERIAQLGLQSTVELMGPRPQAEVIACLRGAGAFAAPCVVGSDGDRDGLPTVLLEAMALGTPCVSTDVTGIPEILRDGETGLLVPQRDPAALARALERLLADPALGSRLAARARAVIEAEFDIERNAAALRDLFLAACRSGGAVRKVAC